MQAVANLACTLGIYRPARLLRNRLVRPDLWRRAARWRLFYSQFISPRDLVFDVGANRGDRTELFIEMGARVVAVEPIPALAERLRNVFRYCPVRVEEVGAGRIASELPLYVCSNSELSSFSSEFIENRARQYSELEWKQRVAVRIVTLDSLIDKYGIPAFAKIDVEGFEPEVLGGLSRSVPVLSFEVHPDDRPEQIRTSLDQLMLLDCYEFNLSLEETLVFELPEWGDVSAVMAVMQRRAALGWRSHGDIYARLAGPRRPSDC